MTQDAKIVEEAKERFRRCEEWESDARNLFLEDLKFANADADNGYQWPNDILRNRNVDDRPCLTINKVRQHNLQIINDARQNKPAVKVRPMGDGASYQAAKIFDGVVRHIEYISNAQAAYDTATRYQVQAGWGYWRVVTDYAGDNTFDQEIYIRRVKDPLTVYLDPDITEVDGSDARFGFVFDDVPKDKFTADYPRCKDVATKAPLGNTDSWITEEYVRVAEYFRKVEESDRLVLIPDTGEMVRESTLKMFGDVHEAVTANPATKYRDIVTTRIEWFKIAGDKIIDRNVWPGQYIPIVRVIAEETVIEGKLDRKGHTRAQKDPQRMYNYWASAAVEHVALQGKTPYVAPAAAIEGLETYWLTANRENHAVLPYNHRDDNNLELPRPERAQPPVMAPAYIAGLQSAREDLMSATGQYQAELGMPSNEKSGVAIQQRQRQGDNATYHYIDHLAIAIRFTGKILIDLIPKIYDTQRVLRILTESGEDMDVVLDPQAKQAYAEQANQATQEVRRIFNPAIGKYEVEADIGPAYATRRQEAFAAFSQIAAQNKELMMVIGDLMFKNADFPGADEIAERLKRLVPPQAMGGPPPEVAQLQEHNQQLQQILQKLVQQLAEEKLKAKQAAADRTIQAFDADTKRIAVENQARVTPKDAVHLAHDVAMASHQNDLSMAARAAEPQETAGQSA